MCHTHTYIFKVICPLLKRDYSKRYLSEQKKGDTNVIFPFPDDHVCQNKELDVSDRVLAECVSTEYSTGAKENGLHVFKTNVYYIIYPVVTVGWDTSGGDNQTFTSKHFHVDFSQLKLHVQG